MPSKNSLSALKKVQKGDSPVLNPEQATESVKPINKVKRINKGFQVEVERAKKWDLLVAQMKADSKNKKTTGPELLDEALDYLFTKYLRN